MDSLWYLVVDIILIRFLYKQDKSSLKNLHGIYWGIEGNQEFVKSLCEIVERLKGKPLLIAVCFSIVKILFMFH